MFSTLPKSAAEFLSWAWEDIEPYYLFLDNYSIDETNVDEWLTGWTQLSDIITEWYARLNIALTINTADPAAEASCNAFLDKIYPVAQSADHKLKRKLLDSGLSPIGFEIPLRKMRVEAEIFRTENLPLLSEERKLASDYNKWIGAQSVHWAGEERTLQQMRAVLHDPRRSIREEAWRLISRRQIADRQAINSVWEKLFALRNELARNANLQDYRAYRWRQMLRLDYTPQDCELFQQAIEQAVVPAATHIYERHRRRLGLQRLRPWDLDQDLYPIHQPALPGYGSITDLVKKSQDVFENINPLFGEYFQILQAENMLELENYRGKAPGAYCTGLPVTRRPFIFMNAIGLASDVRTILHESGHAFHNFERMKLPYAQQRNPGLEFAEVASMAMELLAAFYLSSETDGFYSPPDANRFRIEHIEQILIFWPYMAVVDAFQHWAYTHAEEAKEPAACDDRWLELWQRFIPGVDWSGLDAEAMTGWQRKQHIFRYPFYYIEYGLAQLGAVQIWRNALQGQEQAVADYRRAMALGGMASLPELYRTAGARFAFDIDTLQAAVELLENQLGKLSK